MAAFSTKKEAPGGHATSRHQILTVSLGYPVVLMLQLVENDGQYCLAEDWGTLMNDGPNGAMPGSTEPLSGTAEPSNRRNGSGWASQDLKTQATTIGVIVVGAALIETALIPGMVIGLAAAVAPKYAPQLGAALQPMFRSAVRGAYKIGRRAREAAAEATEQVQDIVAEVHAESASPPENPPHA